ncbi:hypothetical protein [Amycolatopsis sp. NPDC058986]|uniref:hypothetical protein n=1 Tax=unclassified Amycolatopsis TaxID=2618356 RepID=UPI0036728301
MTVAAEDAVARLAALPGVRTASALAAARSSASASGEALPVPGSLTSLLELRRGTTVAVHGSTSLLLALLAGATAAGSWAAVVGMPSLGLAAASELGVTLPRLVLVPRPGGDLTTVVGALLDGLDLVVLGRSVCQTLPASTAQRLARRARSRNALLLAAGAWPGADQQLRCGPGRWVGGASDGRGRLEYREIVVYRDGRGSAAAGASVPLRLPGPGGGLERQPGTGASESPGDREVAG